MEDTFEQKEQPGFVALDEYGPWTEKEQNAVKEMFEKRKKTGTVIIKPI